MWKQFVIFLVILPAALVAAGGMLWTWYRKTPRGRVALMRQETEQRRDEREAIVGLYEGQSILMRTRSGKEIEAVVLSVDARTDELMVRDPKSAFVRRIKSDDVVEIL